MCVCVSKLTSASRTKIVRVQLKRVPKRDCSQRFDSVYDSSNSIIVIIMGFEINRYCVFLDTLISLENFLIDNEFSKRFKFLFIAIYVTDFYF